MDGDEIQPIIHARISPGLEDYRSPYDYEWQRRFNEVVAAAGLEEEALTLTSCWHASLSIRQLPWFVVHTCHGLAQKLMGGENSSPYRLILALYTQISKQATADGLGLSDEQRKSLVTFLEEKMRDISGIDTTNITDNLRSSIWHRMLEEPQVTNAFWHLQHYVFADLYFSFEYFLTRVVESRIDRRRKTRESLESYVSELIGTTQGKIVVDLDVKLYQRLRNAIVHEGSRLSQSLEVDRNKLIIEDEHFVLLCYHVDDAYRHLCSRLLKFVIALTPGDE